MLFLSFGCSFADDFLTNYHDLVTWLANTGIYRMNKDVVRGLREQNDEGEIDLEIGGNFFNFQWAELAPPSGVMAANYSR
jgi:hypothetical protein